MPPHTRRARRWARGHRSQTRARLPSNLKSCGTVSGMSRETRLAIEVHGVVPRVLRLPVDPDGAAGLARRDVSRFTPLQRLFDGTNARRGSGRSKHEFAKRKELAASGRWIAVELRGNGWVLERSQGDEERAGDARHPKGQMLLNGPLRTARAGLPRGRPLGRVRQSTDQDQDGRNSRQYQVDAKRPAAIAGAGHRDAGQVKLGVLTQQVRRHIQQGCGAHG